MNPIVLDNLFIDGKIKGQLKIEGNIIKEIGTNLNTDYCRIIDCGGGYAFPGFTDIHVHLREPGQTNKETVATGTRAAARGGFIRVMTMPNTNPPLDNPEIIKELKGIIERDSIIDVKIWGAATKGLKGIEVNDIEKILKEGICGISDDGMGINNIKTMTQVLSIAKELDLVVAAHCEADDEKYGVIHGGDLAKKSGLPGISSKSEWSVIERDLKILEKFPARYHVCHVSTKESVGLIRKAKEKGIMVTAEVTPHHLVLSQKDILLEPNFKMNPPIRGEEDREELWKGLLDGTIDCIATDHAPHTKEEKNKGLIDSPFGVIGLETAFPVLYTNGVLKGLCDINLLVDKLTKGPSKVMGLKQGYIKEGHVANITVIDINKGKTVNADDFLSKGKNSPFIGEILKGWPQLTIYNGEIVFNDIKGR